MTDLRIGRNNLTDLPAGIFAGLPNLATLTADGNYFTSIDSDWFDGFEGGGTLTRFEFVGNDISEIDADALDGFTAWNVSTSATTNFGRSRRSVRRNVPSANHSCISTSLNRCHRGCSTR